MKVTDIMTRNPMIINEEDTVLYAVEKMKEEDCGILPIGDEEDIVGVITDRDIITRGVAENKDLTETVVAEIMTNDVIFCEEDDALEDVVMKMNQNNIRRVLVKDKEQTLTGIISLGDIIRRIEDSSLLAKLFQETKIA